jgi:hypothetical protein
MAGLRIAVLIVCAYGSWSGIYPPAHAQASIMNAEDATQDANIAGLNKHIDNTDANVLRQEAALNINAMAVAELQGEVRVFFAVLGLLTGTSLVIQVRAKKQA